MDPSLQIIVILKALLEVAGVAFLGQGVLWLLAGANRDKNPVYQLFRIVTSPVTRLTRAITPRIVLDQHVWLVACLLLVAAWLVVVVFKASTCVQLGFPEIKPPGC
jgi:hypothetical protein